MAEPRILHIDMDAFFAAVEQQRDPRLRGKPVIVGGDSEDWRGVVSTASYEARVFGVHSAMPLAQARRLCPHGIYLRGDFARYQAAAQEVRGVLDTVSPRVQPASIDEAYVDVTGSQRLFGGDDAIGAYVKDEIRARTGLPCTVAIAPNKLVAKVASGEAKPDGYRRIGAGEEAAYLAPLPVRKLPGAGPKACELLEALGVLTVGQLAAVPLAMLERVFGAQAAVGLQRAARGEGVAEVSTEHTPKSISRETTFERDRIDWVGIEEVLAYLAERAAYQLREEGLEAQRVTLKVRYADFDTRTFAATLPVPSCLDYDIATVLRGLVPKARARRARVRLVGVCLGALRHNQHQMQLFDGARTEKWERVLEQVDDVRHRLGFEYVRFGRSLNLGRAVRLATPSLSR